MHVAVVVPCYNEVESLQTTCASLGFGAGLEPPTLTELILIDNDSEDGTLSLAKAIASSCPPGTVHVGSESERGYVPPRRAGNRLVQQLAQERSLAPQGVLVLQADADTTYGEGYVDAMRTAAEASEPGTMVQAIMRHPPDFLETFASYVELCERAERGVEWLLQDDPEQVVVDDKAVGYRLSDYIHWGGHVREYFGNGEEMHAETTRFYMKARAAGARLQLVEDASAAHSVRRVLAAPAVDFATSGFPRETSWVRRWRSISSSIVTINDLLKPENRAVTELGANLRRRHIVALFGLLPLHVARTLRLPSRFDGDARLPQLELPKREPDILRAAPAVFIEDVLRALNLFW
jgi:Glycosyl transferase family 2